MNGRILSSSEKRKVLKEELQKMRVRASKSSDYITNAYKRYGDLNTEKVGLDIKISNKDIKIEFIADFISYVCSFCIVSLIISNLVVFILKMDFLNALFINGISCFIGMSTGFIALINTNFKNKHIKFLDKLSNKIENYLKSRQNYKYLINERDRVQEDIQILESGIMKEKHNLEELNIGIGTLDFRLHCSEDRPYKVGKWATIVRKEQPLSRKKDKRSRKRVKQKITNREY